ncbi:MAG: glycosyltransferase [Proteobacteria bacterium]|nr:glycosyltransferase [Pseudomonadota bacterium]
MDARNCVVTYDPLSARYADRLRKRLGCAFEQVVVSDVGGAVAALRLFRGLAADTLYVPVVDETARGHLPLLKCLCLLARGGKRFVVNPDFLVWEFGPLDCVYDALRLGGGVLGGCVALVGEWFRLGALLRAPRIAVHDTDSGRVLYLETDPWPGAQGAAEAAHRRDVVGALLQRGRAVDFATAEMPEGLPRGKGLGIRLMEPLYGYVFPWALNSYRHTAKLIAAVRRLRPARYAFIYQRLAPGTVAGVVLSRLRRLPLVVEYREAAGSRAADPGPSFRRLGARAQAVCLRHAHRIVAVSDGARAELIAAGVEPGRIVLYRRGGAFFDPARILPERIARAPVAEPVPPRPVRVLVNGLHAKTGGGVTYLRNVLPLLAGDPEVKVHLCVHEDQRPLLPEDLGGVTVHFLSFKSGFWRLQFREQVEVPRLARRIGAHVTFSPANYAPLAAPNSVILLRNALSVAFVERRPVKLAYWAAVYLGTALSLIVCRRAIAVSDYARRSAGGALLRLVGGRIIVVPHGVGPIFSPPEGDSRREKFLLSVSDIYVQKNLKNLLYAVARLRASHPDITLKIAGRPIDAHYFKSLKRRVRRDGLEGCVEFLGYVPPEDLVDLYRRCAVFVFPSSVETFGNPLVEAMACGAPIASSNTAAMPEVLGDAAAYFDPADIKDMAGVLDGLLNDAGWRRDLGEKALVRSREFSWQQTAARTLEVLKQAATPQRSGLSYTAAAVSGEPPPGPGPGPR